jgi:hypothetical protein
MSHLMFHNLTTVISRQSVQKTCDALKKHASKKKRGERNVVQLYHPRTQGLFGVPATKVATILDFINGPFQQKLVPSSIVMQCVTMKRL